MNNAWVVVLGASSGFGAATARAFARKGHPIFGVHLDRRATMPAVDALVHELQSVRPRLHKARPHKGEQQRIEKLRHLIVFARVDGHVAHADAIRGQILHTLVRYIQMRVAVHIASQQILSK